MNTPDTFTLAELNTIIRSMSVDEVTRQSFPAPNKWTRVDVGEIECYVGDGLYVVAMIERQPETMPEMEKNQINTEAAIIKYMQGEGWIGKEYVYVGMQRFNLKKPPESLDENYE